MNGHDKELAIEEDGTTHYLKHRWNENAVTLCSKVVWFEPNPNNTTMQVCKYIPSILAHRNELGANCLLCLDLDGDRHG